MALIRELDKLQRRWQENPLGLTFAPLAEAYRKEGMTADALELLTIGLTQHPNYVPAHIVRGRCFLDARDDRSAEQAFLRVAELDPENVIALKALADIDERSGRFAEATTRLERLLDVDRANDEAREQFDRLRATLATPGIGPEASPTPEPVEAFADPVSVPVEPASVVEEPLVEPPPVVAMPEAERAVEPEAPLEPVHVPEPDLVERGAAEPFDDEQRTDPIVAAVRDDVDVIIYQPMELSASETNEFQRGSDAEHLRPSAARGGALRDPPEPAPAGSATEHLEETAAEVEPLPASPVAEASSDARGPGAPESADVAREGDSESVDAEDAEAVAGVEAEPELVVTETMAELFLRQGHKELALAVYSQLGARDPAHPRIRAAIEQLQGEVKREVPSLPVFAAVLTGGQSVRGFFEQLLASARPPAPGASVDPGLSLGAVFGDDAAAGRPAGPAAETAPSFDEFYGEDPIMEATASAAAQTEGEDAVAADLESFTSWLKGLKR